MLARLFSLSLISLPAVIVAQSTPTVLCVPGQCLQGYSNTTIGASLSASGLSTPIHLLPGTYSSTTSPQVLHDALTASSASLNSSPGFSNSTSISLPLNLALQSGLSVYTGNLYSGQATFQSLPNIPVINTSVPLSSRSLALSSNVWIAVTSSGNSRTIVWSAVPDTAQLPTSLQSSFSLVDIQSAACTPGCSASGGVCSASGTCQCLPGFTGSSCESCAAGFFGPTCQACPSNCSQCDEGITGSGRCLKPDLANDPAKCNCKNGVCGTDGKCQCNAGFTTGDDGTACSKCTSGFFQTSSGDCQICQIGCTSCSDGTGACLTCKTGFSKDGNDNTKCNAPQQATSGGIVCPNGSFSSGGQCTPCNSACQTCTAGTANDCVICAQGSFLFNGACVSANTDGICSGSNLIADNNKKECDSCGAKCTKCKIPNFSVASTVNQKQCTECLPGSFLSKGACVDSCPAGTTVSAQDGFTCIPCDSACSTCSGSPTFCLSCPNNQLASSGKCLSSCPSSTFTSNGSCQACHPDCATCSGGSFNQCTACPANRPVLINGRCLPTCAKDQFFDKSTGGCIKCDDSCDSCSASGPSQCLACKSATQVLRNGRCVDVSSDCTGGSVIPGLGVCLNELVFTKPDGTGAAAPLPTVTGLNSPTIIKKGRLEWWQILLMVLGCVFIFVFIIWLFRRKQKKKRQERTKMFMLNGGKNFTEKKGWKLRLAQMATKLFGKVRGSGSWRWWWRTRMDNTPSTTAKIVKPSPAKKSALGGVKIVHLGPSSVERVSMDHLRSAEEARSSPMPLLAPSSSRYDRPLTSYTTTTTNIEEEEDIVRLIGSYNRPAPTPPPTKTAMLIPLPPIPPEPSKFHPYHQSRMTAADRFKHENRGEYRDSMSSTSDSDGANSIRSAPSLYSQITGMPRKGPDARVPEQRELLNSRFSGSTFGMKEDKSKRNPFWK
ncbi:hypothetical protein CPB83DRAFT_851473 [Crepidotus variabilis]|uniref:EGF-like domain-containing protein n=1 Tax=Crepidotus variabilis TaxID=179855 RepID=A0A9P6EI06_9AGAR|nr:hypothetical protein CPB83DRAFT_851473 [Crepidotus variabilis]